MATIVSMDPICVAFDVDQKTVLRLNRLRHEAKMKGEAWDGLPITVSLSDEDFSRRGKIDSMDFPINPATGTALWRAVIPNHDGLLLPGLFVRVRLVTSAPYKALLVPEQAVLTDGGQKSVFVVSDQNIVQKRPVKLGRLHDGQRQVEGLRADEWVVMDHLGHMREGVKVLPERVPPPAESSLPRRSLE
jgi:RND family efflux transporter MFP subunit